MPCHVMPCHDDCLPHAGTYRVVHYGTWYNKPILGTGVYHEYNGTSQSFKVAAA